MHLRSIVTRRSVFSWLVLLVNVPAWAQSSRPADADRVQTIEFAIPGSRPGTTSKAIVVVPADYARREAEGVRYPVVYLLHGYSGSQEDWHKHTKGTDRALDRMADRYGLIIVLPDGKYSSWYLDAVPEAPESADYQWETVITRHLVPEIDRRYRTWAEPAGRGITGLSMGGHGAIYLCARHPELFSACGSMSGVMDLQPFRVKYDLANRLGPYHEHPGRWLAHSAISQAEKFAGRNVGIFIECGLQDTPFIGGNQAMHRRLLELNIPHEYTERPGGHTWPYWVNALPYHLQFMADRLKPAGRAN